MNSKKKKYLLLALIMTVITGLFIYSLTKYDVQQVGPEGTSVGWATINVAVHELTGVHMWLYTVTDILGYVAFGVAGLFGLKGLIQLFHRKSLFKVDRQLIALGILYVVTMGLYVLFEKVVINYRPIIIPGDAHVEASFPSSHTMTSIVIFASASVLMNDYIREVNSRKVIQVILNLLLVITVVGRLLSGVHWFTDIVGGILISCTLLCYFMAFGYYGKK